MHKFSKDLNLGRQWVKFVQVKGAEFVKPMDHFFVSPIKAPDCYKTFFFVNVCNMILFVS